MSSKKTKKGDAIMQRRSLAMFLAAFAAVSVCFSAGCSSGSGTNLNSSVSDIVANVSSGDIYKEKANAATLSNNCKNYYAEVVSGTISAENPGAVTVDTLPSISDPVSKKKNAALMLTVGGAIQYSGLNTLKDVLNSFVGDSATGTIYAISDENRPATATIPITANTTLHQLGYR